MAGHKFDQEMISSLQARFDTYCKKVIYHSVYNTVNKQTTYLMRNWGNSEHMADEAENDFEMDAVKITVGEHVVLLHDPELVDAILTLQKRKQEIVLMNEMLGYSLSEIAEELGISYESVKSAKSKAFRDMRKGADRCAYEK